MKIYFSVEDGDSKQDIIDGINGDGLAKYTWDLAVGYTTNQQALSINKGSNLDVTNQNKDVIDFTYTVLADSAGVTLTDGHGGSFTKMNWSEFSSVGVIFYGGGIEAVVNHN